MQPPDFFGRIPGAGRIGRIGDEDDAGARVDQFQQFIDIDPVARFGRHPNLGLAGAGADGVGAEAELALDDVVARLEESLVQKLEDLVGAAAEQQALRLQAVLRRQRLAQGGGAAIGIHLKLVKGGGEGLASRGAGPEDVLVGRQLQRMLDTVNLGLARHIGGDVHDARLGRRTGSSGAIENDI